MKPKSIILVAANLELENKFRQIVNSFGPDHVPIVLHNPIACLREIKKQDIHCVVIESRIREIAAEEFIKNFYIINPLIAVIVLDNSVRGENKFQKPDGCSIVSIIPSPEGISEAISKIFFDKLEKSILSILQINKPEKQIKKAIKSSSKKTNIEQPNNTRSVSLTHKRFLADVLAIGSSTGGPLALEKVLLPLPSNFPIPIVVTQHMPPVFTKNLAERLNTKCSVKVKEAEDGEILKPGICYIAPGNYHMGFRKNKNDIEIELNQNELINSCRPSVDVMLESLHAICKGKILTVILTGMGSDGAKACLTIKNSGGFVVIQDQESSVVWGMPKSVFELKAHDEVLPMTEIGEFVTQKIMGLPRVDRS